MRITLTRVLVVMFLGLYLVPTIAALGHSVLTVVHLEPSLFSDLTEPRLINSFTRSMLTSSLAATLVVPLLLVGLYGVERTGTAMRRWIIIFILIPLFLPETTHAFAASNMASSLNLSKGMLLLAIVIAGYVLPFCGLIILIQFSMLPRNIYAGARDLGLSTWTYVSRIFGPLIAPVAVAAWMFSFLLAFNEFSRTNYLQGREMYSSYLYGQLNAGTNDAVYLVSTAMFFVGGAVIVALVRRTQKLAAIER